jgi:Tfp pilus assembly protein PilX
MSFRESHPTAQGERGMALVVAVLFVLLTSVLAATFMMSASGERSLSSNVHIAKGSLYAADAGVRVAQQKLATMALAKLDSLVAIWPGNGPVINAPNTLFPAGQMNTTGTSPVFTSSATIAFSDSDLTDTTQVYNYLCTVASTGRRGLMGQRRVQSQSILRVSASRGSFADYLLFTDIHLMPNNGQIWFSSSASFDGRVHTNGEFRFSYKPTFQDLATSVNGKAWYYNKGAPKELAANNNGTIDVPYFYGGFTRGSPNIDLPPNSFNQQNASLGLDPDDSTLPSNTTINGILGTGAGSGAVPTGVYVVHTGAAMTGGLYVQGTLNQCLLSIDNVGRQVYTLTQGSTVTKVTLDVLNNQTLVEVGASTTIYSGQPRGIIYTNGQVSDLRGPDRVSGTPPPAIGTNTQLLVAATGDVVLQRDITSEDFNADRSVLGIYSSGGSVRVGTSAPNNMYLDGYVMATGSDGEFTVDNYSTGSARGTFHLRGGSVTTYYGPFYTFNSSGILQTGYARDFQYDRRGLVPPYFPTTNRFTSDEPIARTIVWKEM